MGWSRRRWDRKLGGMESRIVVRLVNCPVRKVERVARNDSSNAV